MQRFAAELGFFVLPDGLLLAGVALFENFPAEQVHCIDHEQHEENAAGDAGIGKRLHGKIQKQQ